MSNATVRGRVHLIEETKTYGKNGFRKRLVVLEQENARFTNYIPLDFIQDSCDKVDELAEGDEIEVSYRLSGRKWQRDERSEVKYFLSAEAQGFTKLSGSPSASTTSSPLPDDESEYLDDEVPF